MPELRTDPEVADFIDEQLPKLEKSFGKAPVKEALISLYDQDPDQVLQWYLEDQLGSWLMEKVKSFKKPDEDPEEITISMVRSYIEKRYDRYLDYAKYHASLAGLDQQGGDVLHEVILSILLKDEGKVIDLYSKKKKQYRELDYFILRMIKLNCHSKTSPYRWKNRQPHIDGNATVDVLMNSDSYDEAFLASMAYEVEEDEQDEDNTSLITTRFQILRDILEGDEFTEIERKVFTWRFFLDNNWKNWKGKETRDYLTKSYKSAQEKVIAAVEVKREKHHLKVIHEVFTTAKGLELRLHESEFLLLRQLLSDLQNEQENYPVPVGAMAPAEKLEKRMLFRLDQLIKEHDINNKF